MTKIRTIICALLAALACHVTAPAQGDAPPVERDEEARTVRVRLERGGKVELDNRTTGRIVVSGWDRDYIEAVATSERGREYVRASSGRDSAGQRVSLTADYLTPEKRLPDPPWEGPKSLPPAPAATPASPARGGAEAKSQGPPAAARADESPLAEAREKMFEFIFEQRPSEVHLEVKLPRYAEIEQIEVNRSEVEIEGVETPVAVNGRRSTIRLRRVGAVEVRTASGEVDVEGAGGLVDVMTESGDVNVRHVGGDVRVLSLSGEVEVECVTGRVNVNNTSGSVALARVGGDADATTVSGEIRFEGALRADGRYHLKSMSGAVEMSLAPNPPGFTALLSSYRGQIEDGFSLKKTLKSGPNTVNNRVLGRYGNGQAQVTLDSFDGRVKLAKAAGTTEGCKQ
jgi:hypothetical protein